MLKYLGNSQDDSEESKSEDLPSTEEETTAPPAEETPEVESPAPQEPDEDEFEESEAAEVSAESTDDLTAEEWTPSYHEPAQIPEDESDQVAVLKQKITRLERRVSHLERIAKFSEILNSTLTLKPLLEILIQAAVELTNTEACSILLIDPDTEELKFAEVTGGLTQAIKEISVPLDNSIAGWVVRTDKPFLIRDVKNDERWHPKVDKIVGFDTHSLIGVPLKVRDKVIGVLEVVNKQDEQGFSQDDLHVANSLAVQAATAIENARLLDELQQAYRDLSELDQIKTDFVNIAAHELRTPLAVILGYASFLRENIKGQAGEQVEIVFNSAMHLRSIIDDMINLDYIQTNKVSIERTVFSLPELIKEVVAEFAEIIKGKQQTLTTKFSPSKEAFDIDADRQKIFLIFANLIGNAIKFTPKKGRIHVEVEQKGSKYWVSIIDTGIGIPKAEYSRIFDQFYQVEPSLTRKYQGMGLGLSIAKGMVEVHQGRIWVESIVGKGSKFTVVLPSAPEIESSN